MNKKNTQINNEPTSSNKQQNNMESTTYNTNEQTNTQILQEQLENKKILLKKNKNIVSKELPQLDEWEKKDDERIKLEEKREKALIKIPELSIEIADLIAQIEHEKYPVVKTYIGTNKNTWTEVKKKQREKKNLGKSQRESDRIKQKKYLDSKLRSAPSILRQKYQIIPTYRSFEVQIDGVSELSSLVGKSIINGQKHIYINKNLVNVCKDQDAHIYALKLPNNFSFIYEEQMIIKVVDVYMYIALKKNLLTDYALAEILGYIPDGKEMTLTKFTKQHISNNVNLKPTEVDEQLQDYLSSVHFGRTKIIPFSYHTDYMVDKRFSLCFRHQYHKDIPAKYGLTISPKVECLKEIYDFGPVQITSVSQRKIMFVPKFMLEIFVAGQRIWPENTTIHTTSQLKETVRRQFHNVKQYGRLMQILTAADMFHIKISNNATQILTTYLRLLYLNISNSRELLKEQDVGVSEIIESALTEILLPYHYTEYHEDLETVMKQNHGIYIDEHFKHISFDYTKYEQQFIEHLSEFNSSLFSIIKDNWVGHISRKDEGFDYTTEEIIDIFHTGILKCAKNRRNLYVSVLDRPKIEHIKPRRDNIKFSTPKELIDHYINKHQVENSHHVEYWQGKQMSVQATIELLCDHWACGRRYDNNVEIAFLNTLKWLQNQKFKVLNPKGVFIFLFEFSSMEIKTTKDNLVQVPYKKWARSFSRDEMLSLFHHYNNGKAQQWFKENRNDDRVSAFVNETFIHKALVELNYYFITENHTVHDNDKTYCDYAVALLISFGSKETDWFDQNDSLLKTTTRITTVGNIKTNESLLSLEHKDLAEMSDEELNRYETDLTNQLQEFINQQSKPIFEKPEQKVPEQCEDVTLIMPFLQKQDFEISIADNPTVIQSRANWCFYDALAIQMQTMRTVDKSLHRFLFDDTQEDISLDFAIKTLRMFDVPISDIGRNLHTGFFLNYLKTGSERYGWNICLELFEFAQYTGKYVIPGKGQNIYIRYSPGHYHPVKGPYKNIQSEVQDYTKEELQKAVDELHSYRNSNIYKEEVEVLRQNEENIKQNLAPGHVYNKVHNENDLMDEVILHITKKHVIPAEIEQFKDMLETTHILMNPVKSEKSVDIISNATFKTIEPVEAELTKAQEIYQQQDKELTELLQKEDVQKDGMFHKLLQAGKEKTTGMIEKVKHFWGEARETYADLKEFKHAVQEFKSFKEGIFADHTLPSYDVVQTFIKFSRNIVDQFYSETITKILKVFGIPFEMGRTISITKLVFNFIIYKNTSSKLIRYYIILDFLAEAGVLALLFKLIHEVYSLVKVLPHVVSKKTDCDCFFCGEKTKTTTGIYQEYIDKLKEKIKGSKQQEKEIPKEEEIDTGESWFMRVWHGIINRIPEFLGAAGVALAGILGFTAIKFKSISFGTIGETIISASKNIHYLSLGVVAIPKIFETFVSIIDWVMRKLSHHIGISYTSKNTEQEELVKWMEKVSMFKPGLIENLMAQNFSYALQVQNAYMEGLLLEKNILKMPASVQIMFRGKMKDLSELHPKAVSLAKIHTGCFEPFHIQFCGEPGVGKTDLAQRTIDEIGPILTKRTGKMTYYPMNETLTHMDNYYGQEIGLIDDDNVNKNIPPEVISTRLMMISGFPVIANMASLNDKGRIINFKLLVSNTNTAEPSPDGMYTPEALHRRRVLIQPKLKPGKSLDDYTTSERALQKHLLFDMLQPTQVSNVLIPDMDSEQLFNLLKLLAEKHTAVENERTQMKSLETRRKYLDNYEQFFNNCILKVYEKEKGQVAVQKKLMDELLKLYTDSEVIIGEAMSAKLQVKTTTKLENLLTTAVVPVYDRQRFRFSFEKASEYTVSKVPPTNFDFRQFIFEDDQLFYKSTDPNVKHEYLLYCFEEILAHTLNSKGSMKLSVQQKILELQNKSNLYEIAALKYEKMQEVKNTWCTRLMRVIKNFMSSAWDFVNKVFLSVVVNLVSLGVTLIFLTSIGMLLVGEFGIVNSDSPEPTSYKGKQKDLKVISSYYCDIQKQSEKALYLIKYTDDTGNTSQQNMVGIKGNIFLISNHFFDNLPKGDIEIEITDPLIRNQSPLFGNKMTSINVSRDVKRLTYKGVDCDSALLFIRNFRSVGDTTKKFVKEIDLQNNMQLFDGVEGMNISLDRGATFHICRGNIKLSRWETLTRYKTGLPVNARTLSMDFEVEDGFSGSLMSHTNTHVQEPFLGIAMASGAGMSYYTVVSQEMIEAGLKQFAPETKIKTTCSKLVVPDRNVQKYRDLVENTLIVGTFSPSQKVPPKTKFFETPIHGVVPVETTPAILSVDDSRWTLNHRHPYQVALQKYGKAKQPLLTYEEEKRAINLLLSGYSDLKNSSTLRVWNTYEAVAGVRKPGSTSIDLSTSPGLPYKLTSNKKGKTSFISFDDTNGAYNIDDSIIKDVNEYIEYAQKGEVRPNLKVEFIKDELVAYAKIENPKTRTVTTGNLIHLLIYRMLFGDLNRLVKISADGTTYSSLGLNFETHHWDNIAKKNLRRTRDSDLTRVIELDVKSWESIVTGQLMYITMEAKIKLYERIYKARNEILPDWFRPTAHALAVDFVHAFVVFEDIVLEKKQGMISGHPGTLSENSDMHYVLIFTIINRILDRKGFQNFQSVPAFKHHFGMVLAADDMLMSMTEEMSAIMTPKDIFEGYKQMSIEVTAANKNAEILEFKNIEEATFLKMSFVNTNGYYRPLPKTSIIYQLLNYQREGEGRYTQFMTNLTTAFRFAFWHGENWYEELREKVNSSLIQINYPTFSIDYKAMGNLIKHQPEMLKFIRNNTKQAVEREKDYIYDIHGDYYEHYMIN
nr:RNA-dependent RNA polymerase [Polycipiviridae sp.]